MGTSCLCTMLSRVINGVSVFACIILRLCVCDAQFMVVSFILV